MSFVSKFRNLAAPLSNLFKTTTLLQKTALHSSAALQCTESGDTERKKLEKKFKEDIARDFDWLSDPHKRQPGHIITLVPPIKKEWVDKICDKGAHLDIEVNKELLRSNKNNKTYSYLCS